MTIRGFSFSVLAGVLLLAPGCSDDTSLPVDSGVDLRREDQKVPADTAPPTEVSTRCALSIESINGQASGGLSKLTGADDQDSKVAGIQIEVEVSGTGLTDGTQVTLDVTDLAPSPQVDATSGKAVFSGVTVSSTIAGSTVLIVASAPNCTGARLSLPVEPPPECVFVDPADGVVLGAAQDKISGNATFDYDIKLRTTNGVGGSISLSVDGNSVGKVDPIPGSGNVTFSDRVLASGEVKLEAEVELGGVKGICRATLTVQTEKPGCKVTFSPAAVTTPDAKNGLGVAQDAKPSTPGIESNISVETEANATVTLLIDGQAGAPVMADATGKAAFNAQPLTDGEHEVKATCVSTLSGNIEQSAASAMVVDSVVPPAPTNFACRIANQRERKISCDWTSAGAGAVDKYLLRYSTTAALDDATWPAVQSTEVSEAPYPAGRAQGVTFEDRAMGTSYYISIRAIDAVGNISTLANAAPVTVELHSGALEGNVVQTGDTAQWGAEMVTGDFNCDGYSDLAVGDPGASLFDGANWLTNVGRVAIYFGNDSGYLATATYLKGSVAGGRFGAKLASLADFNGDQAACNDLAVVASHGWTSATRVFVYLGRGPAFFERNDLGMAKGAELVYTLPGAAGSDEVLGEVIASAGDFNGDGATDLAVLHRTAAAAAQVVVISGDKTVQRMAAGRSPLIRPLPTVALTTIGPGVAATGGMSPMIAVAGGASLDGDAYDDLVISFVGEGQGTVYVAPGAQTPAATVALTTLGTKIVGDTDSVSFGSQVALVGNMDGGPNAEFAVADPGRADGAGAVYVFNLATTPAVLTDALFVVSNDVVSAIGDKFGISLAGGTMGADFNKDGFSDLLVGAQAAGSGSGVAYLFFGGAAPLGARTTTNADGVFAAPSGAVGFGVNALWAKDIDKDGFNDVIVADPSFASNNVVLGRVHYYH